MAFSLANPVLAILLTGAITGRMPAGVNGVVALVPISLGGYAILHAIMAA